MRSGSEAMDNILLHTDNTYSLLRKVIAHR